MSLVHVQSWQSVFQRWPRLLLAAAAIILALLIGAVGFTRPAHAASTINVTTTTDEFDTSGSGTGCSLREAIQSANTNANFGGCTGSGGGAPFTINLQAGTYKITINPGTDENNNVSGDFDVTSSITFQGAGAASTIIDALSADRVFDISPLGGCNCTVTLAGITIQNGKASPINFNAGGAIFINSDVTATIQDSTIANSQAATTGGAIENRGSLTLNNVTLSGNTAGALGGAVNTSSTVADLTVNSSTFSGNKAESGGALYVNTDAAKNVNITNSKFTGNQTVATAGGVSDDGGAIAIFTDGGVTITGSTFTGNSAVANGGAIALSDSNTQAAVGTLTMSYNRIVGNTAVAGNGLYRYSGNATAQKNWWGCNTGPSAAPCDVVVNVGAASFTPWIVLTHTASPSTIGTGQTSTLTADFLKNSDGSANAASSLGALVGVPVSFGNAVLGSISNAQSTIQANGAATATYTAGGSPGAGSATATVDSAPVIANLTISGVPPAITIQPGNQTVAANTTASFSAAASGNPAPSVQWQVSTDGGASWTNISGATSTTLSFTAQAVDNGKQFRAVFTNSSGTATTNAATLILTSPPQVADQPMDLTICENRGVTFVATASGSPAPTQQWQVSTDTGANWTNIPGATSGALTFTAVAADNGKQFRAVFTNSSGSATSNGATLTVNTAPAITTQPADQTVLASATASFSAAASGRPTPTVQWQVSTDGGSTWTDISGATGATLSFTAQAGDNGKQFRAVFTTSCGTATSNAAKLAVITDTTPPVITPNVAGTLGNNGWYVGNVSLTWTVSDPESPITAQTGCGPQSVTADTAGVTFTCTATSAGGPNSKSVTIKRDATKPTVVSGTPSRGPDANGWYNTSVTVSFAGTDATSGIASCTSPTYSGPDSASASVSGTCTDNAGNTSAPGSLGLKYDATKPTLNPTVTPNPASLNLPATATPNASDATSGVATQSCAAVDTSSIGSKSVSCTATDNAGNTNTAPASYTVVNDPPTISVAAGGTCAADGSPSGSIKLTVNDINTGPNGLTLSVVSNTNTKLVPNSGVVFGGSGGNRTMSVTATAGKSGTAVLTVGVSDGVNTTRLAVTVAVGGNGINTVTGTAGSDMLFGGNAVDTLNGLGGNDLLCGGNGNDTLNGGAGDDTLYGNRGDDSLTGGLGADFFSGGPGTDTATDFTPSQGDAKDSTVEKATTVTAAGADGSSGADAPTLNNWLYLPTLQK